MEYNWDEMSDREIDALVAEKVMGFKRATYEGEPSALQGMGGWDRGNGHWSNNFRPTTDISDAWEVVEKLASIGRYLDIRTFADYYDVGVYRTDGAPMNASVLRPSAPKAISLAALRAVGVDI